MIERYNNLEKTYIIDQITKLLHPFSMSPRDDRALRSKEWPDILMTRGTVYKFFKFTKLKTPKDNYLLTLGFKNWCRKSYMHKRVKYAHTVHVQHILTKIYILYDNFLSYRIKAAYICFSFIG